MTATAMQAFEAAASKGEKTYNRKRISDLCARRVHSECSGAVHTFTSYTVPTRLNCPCKCHTPAATCKRCGMSGLAWAEAWKFRRSAWSLYQPLERPLNNTYRMEHHCGVDHNVAATRGLAVEDLLREERAWVRTERFAAREDGDDRRSAALTAYSPIITDLARPGGLTFEQIVQDELPEDEDIRERARALFEAGKDA